MRAEELFYALGEIDDRHLKDVMIPVSAKKPIVWIRRVSVAACAVLMATVMVIGVYVSAVSTRQTPSTTDHPSVLIDDTSVLSTLVPITSKATDAESVYPTENVLYENDSSDDERQTTYYTYEELCELSSVIVKARVLGQYYDPNEIVASSDPAQTYRQLYAKVRVEYVYKFTREIVGEEILYIKDNGYGIIGEDHTVQSARTIGGGPLMETGNTVLLFLNLLESNDEADVFELAVPAISKFYYDADELYHSSALYQPKGSTNRSAHMLHNYRPRDMAEILSACGIRQMLTISLVPFGADEETDAGLVYPTANTCYPNNASLTEWSLTTYYTFGDLMNGADEVLTVRVLGQYRDPASGDIYAKVQVKISNLKPSSTLNDGDILYIKDNGSGMFDENGVLVSAMTAGGGPLMEKGNEVLVFLKESESTADYPVYELLVNAVSKFYFDEDGRYHASGLYQCAGSGNMYPEMLADYEPKTLIELKAELGQEYDFGTGIMFGNTADYPDGPCGTGIFVPHDNDPC